MDETNCDDNPSVGQAGFQAEPNDNALHAPGSTVQPIVAEVEGAYQPLEQEADESTGGSSSNYIPELETVEAPGKFKMYISELESETLEAPGKFQ